MCYMISSRLLFLCQDLELEKLGHFFLALDYNTLRGDDRLMAVRWLSES